VGLQIPPSGGIGAPIHIYKAKGIEHLPAKVGLAVASAAKAEMEAGIIEVICIGYVTKVINFYHHAKGLPSVRKVRAVSVRIVRAVAWAILQITVIKYQVVARKFELSRTHYKRAVAGERGTN